MARRRKAEAPATVLDVLPDWVTGWHYAKWLPGHSPDNPDAVKLELGQLRVDLDEYRAARKRYRAAVSEWLAERDLYRYGIRMPGDGTVEEFVQLEKAEPWRVVNWPSSW
ncbi:hypothetical protein [Nonomuraea basaltis]|uniref:hypothetical protein n=1 Tax=Nonomuraea basaltis TaxID=2495887 RepID=UPI00110C4011|nr:hypothetical protein [Nonomuraea basaltis]TMR95590.1 hypothetical protein EJK15_27935 [Nonomuraea basaltis]